MPSAEISLGHAIRELRERTGRTQADVARELGIQSTYLSRLERNHCEPSVALLRKLACALDVPFALLLATVLMVDVPSSGVDAYGDIVRRLWVMAGRRRNDASGDPEADSA